MKKNQSAPPAPLSVKELKKRYEQPAKDTSPSQSLHETLAPKDKRHPSPKLEELKKRYEQPALETHPKISPSTNGSPKDKRQPHTPENPEKLQKYHEKSATMPEQSGPQKPLYATPAPPQPVRMAPQRPPRLKDKELKESKVQESGALHETSAPQQPVRIAPQRPPRLRDKELKESKVQESEALHETPAPAKPLRMRVSEQKSPSSQQDDEIYATPAPAKPPRMHVSEQKSPSSQQDDEIYATPAPATPPRMHVSEQKSPSSQQDDEIYATSAPATPPRTQKTSAHTMERELLISAYEEEIRHWCGIVYGDRLVLDQRLQEVRENPAMGDQLSWEISEHPQCISQFAGKTVLGLKTKARKAAEENFSSLCDAIGGFAYTLKYTQENTVRFSQTEQSPHEEQSTQKVQKAENVQQPPSPEKERKPLSHREIANRVQKDPSVIYGQTEIQYWCKLVYGDPFVLHDRTEDIQKVTVLGEELSWQVANNPTMFSKLAGKQMLGIKSSARKKAEENISTLCTAINDYTETVKKVRENIVQEHQAQQNHQRQSSGSAQDLQKQQTLSKPPKLPEKTVTARNDAAETSRQEQHKSPDVRPRKVGKAQGIAFTS